MRTLKNPEIEYPYPIEYGKLVKVKMVRQSAFFMNGGAGRHISSTIALELYAKENPDDDFIVVCEGGTDAYKGHPYYITEHMIIGIKTCSKIYLKIETISRAIGMGILQSKMQSSRSI